MTTFRELAGLMLLKEDSERVSFKEDQEAFLSDFSSLKPYEPVNPYIFS